MNLQSLFIYEQNTGRPETFREWDLPRPMELAESVLRGKDDLSVHLRDAFGKAIQQALDRWENGQLSVANLREPFVAALNQWVGDIAASREGVVWNLKSLYGKEPYAALGQQCLEAFAQPSVEKLTVEERCRLNRGFLERSYPESFQVASPFTCGVGMAADPVWDPEEAFQIFGDGSEPDIQTRGRKRRGRSGLGPMGLPDDHRLLRATRLWSTGILIHERVVVTAAHAPRSPLVMGDRVLIPGIGGKTPFPQRILRVNRILDHPKAGKDPSYDVRLMILHYEDALKGVTPEMAAQVEKELRARWRPVVSWEGEDPVTLYGLVNVNAVGPAQTYSQKLAVARTLPDGEKMRDIHRYEAVRERILEPVWPLGTAQKQSEFGDSGAPVVSGLEGKESVVGMYVRRSTNRPVSKQPDLVAIRLYEILQDWGAKVLERHGIQLGAKTVSETKLPESAA